jgi:hypothetical protein
MCILYQRYPKNEKPVEMITCVYHEIIVANTICDPNLEPPLQRLQAVVTKLME